MELFTLDRSFIRQDVVDVFESAIWTDRYYGDGDVQLNVPATPDNLMLLADGTFLGRVGSNEIMILETQDIEKGIAEITGISLTQWLNNRFIRTTPAHEDRYWYLSGLPAGQLMSQIVYNMCCAGSPFLSGAIPMGVFNPGELIIPGLTVGDYDGIGSATSLAVPYGPVYDALRDIGTTYQIGMQVVLDHADANGFKLVYRTYRGLDRTSTQQVNPTVRFSPDMDSLANIKELNSIASLKTLAYVYAPSNPNGLATTPGQDELFNLEGGYSGFDLRALLVFADDLTTDNVGSDAASLLNVLNSRAVSALDDNKTQHAVDGEIIQTSQYQYGVHYNLGDIIEMIAYSGVIQRARVTEYIHSQDDSGETAYPTLAATAS
jgi:hypothetical protein